MISGPSLECAHLFPEALLEWYDYPEASCQEKWSPIMLTDSFCHRIHDIDLWPVSIVQNGLIFRNRSGIMFACSPVRPPISKETTLPRQSIFPRDSAIESIAKMALRLCGCWEYVGIGLAQGWWIRKNCVVWTQFSVIRGGGRKFEDWQKCYKLLTDTVNILFLRYGKPPWFLNEGLWPLRGESSTPSWYGETDRVVREFYMELNMYKYNLKSTWAKFSDAYDYLNRSGWLSSLTSMLSPQYNRTGRSLIILASWERLIAISSSILV